jgi:hypothetical protein
MNTVAYGLGLGPGTGGTTTVVIFDAGMITVATPVITSTVVTGAITTTVITPLIS